VNIVLTDISKSYNGTDALTASSALITTDSINVVIGPNGSGKSTLLRIASLIEPPDSGTIEYKDSSVTLRKNRDLKRKIAVVLPGNSLFNDTVFHNVSYGLRIRKMRKQETKEKVRSILDLFQLNDKIKSHARDLSSGEAQRVALARALVIEPDYLFLDEPTASIDPVNAEMIESVITKIMTSRKITIMMVTHNMFQARRLAQKVIFMYRGKVIEEGSTKEIFSSPTHEMTKRFVTGTMVW
jgi:tungstate transport system ATP-binding protein